MNTKIIPVSVECLLIKLFELNYIVNDPFIHVSYVLSYYNPYYPYFTVLFYCTTVIFLFYHAPTCSSTGLPSRLEERASS